MTARPTPTAPGYAAMWGWSVLFCSLLIGAAAAIDDGDVGALAIALVALVFAGVGSLPVAPLGLWLIHEVCREIEAQWVHVLVSTGVGAMCGVAYAALFDGAWFMVPLLAVSVGLARWAVVPHVPAYRERRRLRQRRRQPVDDDFAGAPPRW